MAEYRLEELVDASGVSSRNIRAYRERGLLDPPRRVGRAAVYDDHHLSQLQTINQLLRRGYTSAHIAEFFAGMRDGHDLAGILGLQAALFGPRTPPAAIPIAIDPNGDEARRLLAAGLAEEVDGALAWVDPQLAEIVGRVEDPMGYVRVVLALSDAAAESMDALAVSVMQALEDGIVARFGEGYVPRPGDVEELQRLIPDFRELALRVVADRLDDAMRRRLVTAMSDYTTNILVSGQWERQRH